MRRWAIDHPQRIDQVSVGEKRSMSVHGSEKGDIAELVCPRGGMYFHADSTRRREEAEIER